MLTKDCGFELKAIAETGIFSGYGSVFGNVDQGDDIVAKGAFAESLKGWTQKGQLPALLWQHNTKEPIGVYTKMAEDDVGLYVEGQLALKTQRGAEAYELMKMKAVTGLSIGFQTTNDTFDSKTSIRTINNGELWEVSLVTFPMNQEALINAVKSIEEIEDFKSASEYLRNAGGLSRSESTAFISRLKALSLRNAADEESKSAILAALSRNQAIFK